MDKTTIKFIKKDIWNANKHIWIGRGYIALYRVCMFIAKRLPIDDRFDRLFYWTCTTGRRAIVNAKNHVGTAKLHIRLGKHDMSVCKKEDSKE